MLLLLCQLEHVLADLITSGSRKVPFYVGLSTSYQYRERICKSALQGALQPNGKVILTSGYPNLSKRLPNSAT